VRKSTQKRVRLDKIIFPYTFKPRKKLNLLILPKEILSERIVLFALCVEHAVDYFQLVDKEHNRLSSKLKWVQEIVSQEDMTMRIHKKEEERAKGRIYSFGIFKKDINASRRLIGGCGVFNISQKHRSCEIG
jgi:RimJ/RimL family protein N-acetyltransferase